MHSLAVECRSADANCALSRSPEELEAEQEELQELEEDGSGVNATEGLAIVIGVIALGMIGAAVHVKIYTNVADGDTGLYVVHTHGTHPRQATAPTGNGPDMPVTISSLN